MENSFLKVKNFLIELEYNIVSENEKDGSFVIERESEGINNMLIVCADPMLIMQQFLFDVKGGNDATVYKSSC